MIMEVVAGTGQNLGKGEASKRHIFGLNGFGLLIQFSGKSFVAYSFVCVWGGGGGGGWGNLL